MLSIREQIRYPAARASALQSFANRDEVDAGGLSATITPCKPFESASMAVAPNVSDVSGTRKAQPALIGSPASMSARPMR